MHKEIFPPDSIFLKEDPRRARWAIPYHHACLNARVATLLTAHGDCLGGKRVLDLASHMGTFSYAVLKLGAQEVVGVEREEKLVRQSERLFRESGVNPSRYRFVHGDALAYLEESADVFDTILCFGLLYYLPDPYRLLQLAARVARETLLLDTFTACYAAVQGKEAEKIRSQAGEGAFHIPLMFYILTQPEKTSYTLPGQFIQGEKKLVLQGLPTKSLLENFFDSLGLRHRQLDWSPYIQKPVHWSDLIPSPAKKASHWADVYASEIRVSYRITVPHRENSESERGG